MNGLAADTSPVGGLVSIVIVNWNGGEMLMKCLRSVAEQSYRPVEVILVDNASIDGSIQNAAKEYPDIRIVQSPINVGFAGGNNLGVGAARGDYVALLNNDTVVDRLWLEQLKHMIDTTGAAVVTSKVITEGVPDEWYEMNGSLNYLGYNIMRVFADLSHVYFAGGASLIFRRETVGLPFLSEYFLYHEDVYLSWRMRLMGYDVRMAQESVVRHRGSASTAKQPSALTTFYQERNRILNCFIFYEPWTLLRLLPYFAGDAVVKTVLSLLGRGKSFRGIVRAYAWLAGNARWILRLRREIQSRRTVRDSTLLSLMSCNVLASGSGVAPFVNVLSRWYSFLVRLPHHV